MDAINVEVSTLPLINLVWGGTLAMILGGATVAASSWTPHTRGETQPTTTTQKEPGRKQRPSPPTPTTTATTSPVSTQQDTRDPPKAP